VPASDDDEVISLPGETLKPNDTIAGSIAAHGLYSDDGGVTLRSDDGKLFKIHAHILKKASTYFQENFAWERVRENRDAPVDVEQDNATLHVLVRLLYPEDAKPSIQSPELLISVLRATKDLGITSFVVRAELAAHIDAEHHPLRAWSLATVFDFSPARRNAAERYLKADSDFLDEIPSAVSLVSGMQVCELVRLIGARERVLQAAKSAISEHRWSCYQCKNGRSYPTSGFAFQGHPEPNDDPTNPDTVEPAWRRAFLARTATMNPFAPETTSEMHFELCAAMVSNCEECKTSFATSKARQARDRLREELKDILSATLEEIAPVRACQHAFSILAHHLSQL